MMRCEFADIGARFVRGLRSVAMVRGIRLARFEETSARGKEPRASYLSRALIGPYREDQIVILAKRRHRCHTIRKIFIGLLGDVFFGVVSGRGIGAIV